MGYFNGDNIPAHFPADPDITLESGLTNVQGIRNGRLLRFHYGGEGTGQLGVRVYEIPGDPDAVDNPFFNVAFSPWVTNVTCRISGGRASWTLSATHPVRGDYFEWNGQEWLPDDGDPDTPVREADGVDGWGSIEWCGLTVLFYGAPSEPSQPVPEFPYTPAVLNASEGGWGVVRMAGR